jgi:hypothetical protein
MPNRPISLGFSMRLVCLAQLARTVLTFGNGKTVFVILI